MFFHAFSVFNKFTGWTLCKMHNAILLKTKTTLSGGFRFSLLYLVKVMYLEEAAFSLAS